MWIVTLKAFPTGVEIRPRGVAALPPMKTTVVAERALVAEGRVCDKKPEALSRPPRARKRALTVRKRLMARVNASVARRGRTEVGFWVALGRAELARASA